MVEQTDDQPNAAPRTFRACGPCTLCCKLMLVPELDKPAGKWCQHCAKGVGCTIRAERPQGCADFQCVWTFAETLDERWRPDRCKFVLRAGIVSEMIIEVDASIPDAWRREPYYAQIKAWSTRGAAPPHLLVMVRDRGRLLVVFPEGEIDLGPEQPDMRLDTGYEHRGGRLQPFARYEAADAPPLLDV